MARWQGLSWVQDTFQLVKSCARRRVTYEKALDPKGIEGFRFVSYVCRLSSLGLGLMGNDFQSRDAANQPHKQKRLGHGKRL